MLHFKRLWRLGPTMLWIVFLLNLSACIKPQPEPLDASISVRCAPPKPCVSVTQGFVLDYGRLYEDLIRTQAKLAACQAR